MKTFFLSALSMLCCFLFFSCNSSQTSLRTNPDTSDWEVYRNEEYGYEIKFPHKDSCKLVFWSTRLPELKGRNGKSFTLAPRDEALASMLSVQLHPGLSAEEILKMSSKTEEESNSKKLFDVIENMESRRDSVVSRRSKLEVVKTGVIVNGKEGLKLESRFPTGELVDFRIFLDGVVFYYKNHYGSFSDKDAKEIISTFRFIAQ